MTRFTHCPICRLRLEWPAGAQILRCDRCQHIFEATLPEESSPPAVLPADEAVESIPEVLPAGLSSASDTLGRRPGPHRSLRPVGNKGSPDAVLWWKGNYIDGLNVQAGVVVLRPNFVAFIPSEKSKNLVGVLAGGLASAVSPIHVVSLDWLRRRPDPLQMVNDLWADRRDDFEPCLFEIVEHLGGFVWSRTSAAAARLGKRLTGASEGLTFMRKQVELRGYAPTGAVLDHLLEGWEAAEASARSDVIGLLVVSVLPLLLAAALFVGSLLTPDIPAWAPLIGLGMAGVLYVAAGIKVAWLRLRRRRSCAAPPSPLAPG